MYDAISLDGLIKALEEAPTIFNLEKVDMELEALLRKEMELNAYVHQILVQGVMLRRQFRLYRLNIL